MFLNFLKSALPGQKVKTYLVALGELPSSVSECDGWIISGSPKGVYDNDPWIAALGGFVQEIARKKKPLIGVCFGHQLVAHFLGGRTEKSPKGWGVGVRKFDLIAHKPWMKPALSECSLIFSHQDQVVALPKGAELLGKDDFCPYPIYSIENHVFCFQGHPEFTPEFAKGRLDARVKLIGQETYDRAVESLNSKTKANDVGQWMRNFFLLGAAENHHPRR